MIDWLKIYERTAAIAFGSLFCIQPTAIHVEDRVFRFFVVVSMSSSFNSSVDYAFTSSWKLFRAFSIYFLLVIAIAIL